MSNTIFEGEGLLITGFYGGKARGRCLSIDISGPQLRYYNVELTQRQAKIVRENIDKWLGSIITPNLDA